MKVKLITEVPFRQADLTAVIKWFKEYERFDLEFKLEKASNLNLKWEDETVTLASRVPLIDPKYDVTVVCTRPENWGAKGDLGQFYVASGKDRHFAAMQSDRKMLRARNEGWCGNRQFPGTLRHELCHAYSRIKGLKDRVHELDYEKKALYKVFDVAQVPMKDDRKTGYGFTQRTAEGYLHPAEDINSGKTGDADYGMPVYPMAAGEVVFAENAGGAWGNIIVVHHPELEALVGHPVWSRCAHFSKINVKVGAQVKMGIPMALCGKSGTPSPHTHWEVIIKKLPTWKKYTHDNGKPWDLKKVKEHFDAPYEFIKKVNILGHK